MSISQKCQYALRALFELAKRSTAIPTTVAEIAQAQAIPPRFLELILGQLRRGGFVQSRRGVQGGYLLAAEPGSVTAGEIIRFVDGPMAPVRCIAGGKGADCPLHGDCAFMGLWRRAQDAVSKVYDETTLQDLVDEERAAATPNLVNYCI